MQEDTLRIATIVDFTEAEGPGKRFALWVQGCPIRCAGCCNPEMFNDKGGTLWSVVDLFQRIVAARYRGIEGVTFLGGEPFMQAPALAKLAVMCREFGLTVMVFSGYTVEDIRKRDNSSGLLTQVDILVDGQYDRDRPEPAPPVGRRWIGSSNQIMHYLTNAYAASDPRMWESNTIEVRITANGIMANGWPSADKLVRLRR